MVLPLYDESEREKTFQTRLHALQRIALIHIPTNEDTYIINSLRRCLYWGYVGRNPMSFDTIEQVLKGNNIEVTDSLKRYLRSFHAPIYGFPIIGVSGVGKTTSIDNVLSLQPQVINHTCYRNEPFETMQLVWLKVDCPSDGTPKNLCVSIIRSVDAALGTDYSNTLIKNRMSTDALLVTVCQLLQSLHLGVLLIDDLQNLRSSKSNASKELSSFIISLSNSLKIPIIMIGTPKILTLLKSEFQIAKRVLGEGEIRMMPMQNNTKEWNLFLTSLWKYQFTQKVVPLTEEIKDVFFDECSGIPFLATILYKLVQEYAIASFKETFSVADLHHIAAEKLGITAKMKEDLQNGIDVDLGYLHDLWKVQQI